MALNGSASVEATPNGCDILTFSWTATQDSEAKTSTIAWTMTLVANDSGTLNVTDAEIYPWAVTIDGQEFSGNSNICIAAGETIALASGEAVLAHNDDGTKSFEYTFMQDFGGLTWGSTGDVINEVTGTGTGELDAFTVKFDIKAHLAGYIIAICAPARGFSTTPTAYRFDANTQTLTINSDDGSLSHSWDWDSMQYDVAVKT